MKAAGPLRGLSRDLQIIPKAKPCDHLVVHALVPSELAPAGSEEAQAKKPFWNFDLIMRCVRG
eukprot:4889368-Pyramimonas_sp.AAC.1